MSTAHRPKISLHISNDEIIQDLHATRNDAILFEIIALARSTVSAGGVFILEETAGHDTPVSLASYKTTAAIDSWVADINKLRIALGRPEIN
jgi:hypothetical protein